MALGPYITDADLKSAVAAALGVTSATLAPAAVWDEIIPGANASATNDIATALMGKGYSSSDISAWDEVESYSRDLGTFWALTRGAGLGGYSAPQLKTLDRREELKLLAFIIIDGVPVAAPAPNTSAVGGISSGVSTANRNAACAYYRQIDGTTGYGYGYGQNRNR